MHHFQLLDTRMLLRAQTAQRIARCLQRLQQIQFMMQLIILRLLTLQLRCSR